MERLSIPVAPGALEARTFAEDIPPKARVMTKRGLSKSLLKASAKTKDFVTDSEVSAEVAKIRNTLKGQKQPQRQKQQRFSHGVEMSREKTFDLAVDTPLRAHLRHLLQSDRFDTFMAAVIGLNLVLMVFQTNAKVYEDKQKCDGCSPNAVAMDSSEYIFQGIYTVECVSRLYVLRRSFFRSKWNLLDLGVVLLGYVDIFFTIWNEVASSNDDEGDNAFSQAAVLRIFRIFRLVRIVRIVQFVPELWYMIRGFFGAMMAMFWGGVMICILLLLWAIFAVEAMRVFQVDFDKIDGPDSSTRKCEDAFSSVQACMLMFFQTLCAGDSWGHCAIPIIKNYPYAVVIFVGALVTVQLGFTNLILAVIVERASQNSQRDAAEQVEEQRKARLEAAFKVRALIESIDEDGSGTISMDEFTHGYETNNDLRELMALLHIHDEDLEPLFKLLMDDDGEVRYQEFVDNLRKCEVEHLPTQTMMLDLGLKKIHQLVDMRKQGEAKEVSPPWAIAGSNGCTSSNLESPASTDDVERRTLAENEVSHLRKDSRRGSEEAPMKSVSAPVISTAGSSFAPMSDKDASLIEATVAPKPHSSCGSRPVAKTTSATNTTCSTKARTTPGGTAEIAMTPDDALARMKNSLETQLVELRKAISGSLAVQMQAHAAAIASNTELLAKLVEAVICSDGSLFEMQDIGRATSIASDIRRLRTKPMARSPGTAIGATTGSGGATFPACAATSGFGGQNADVARKNRPVKKGGGGMTSFAPSAPTGKGKS